MPAYREYNFDGIVGPTHHYGGLSWGNLASTRHGGHVGNPRAAALEGLAKMRLVASLGVGQAVLPPAARPPVGMLERLGYRAPLAQALPQAFDDSPAHLSRLFSASSMWTANAATVFPSCDTEDGRLHLLVANLSAMAHRSLEADHTTRVLGRVFASREHFQVHRSLPAYLGDEGAANQLRLQTQMGTSHILAWGRSFQAGPTTSRFVARQSLEASQAAARLGRLERGRLLLWQQAPSGIDAGAFHSDVLAVSNREVLLLHEAAFVHVKDLLAELRRRLDNSFCHCMATARELSVEDAVKSYPFNSQLVTLPDGDMALIAPADAEHNASAARFLERAQSEVAAIRDLHYVDVNSSMQNGGGPACLRLRVLMCESERNAVSARVFFDDQLHADLRAWVMKHYRSELSLADFRDPLLVEEGHRALDELTQILQLGSVYAFQQNTGSWES